MAINRDEDGRFQEMARALAVQERPRKTRIADSIDEGFDSLDPDPYLFSRDDDDDYNGDSRMYVRDYSRPSAGTASQAPSFWLPLHDLGDGRVDIRAAAGWLNGQEGTFTRATAATCRLKSGLLKKVASGVPRSHYLASGAYGGYLAEGARTNLCLQSEDFATTWAPVASGVVAANTADTTAPDGTSTADKFTAGAALFGGIIRQSFAFVISTAYAQSVFVKKGSHRYVGLRISTAATSDNYNFIDLDTGVIDNSVVAGAVLSSEAWANGWYRLSLTFTTPGAAPGNVIDIALVDAAGAADITTAGTETVYLWGAQLEAAAFASSYIPTTTASVTRNADQLDFPAAGVMAVGTDAGAVACEISTTSVVSTAARRTAVATSNGVGNNRFEIRGISDLAIAPSFAYGTGSNVQQIDGSALTVDTVKKLAVSYGPAGGRLSDSGAAIQSNANASNLATQAKIGIGSGPGSTSSVLFGTVKTVRIWQRGIPDAQLPSYSA